MSAIPLIDEQVAEQDDFISLGALTSNLPADRPEFSRLSKGERRFRVFPAHAGFEILPTIDRVADYCVEPNIFFAPRFCVPAMPRLDDRQVRLMVLQDSDDQHSETRFLMPFTVEKPGFSVGPDIVRAWSNHYGPFGVPLIERREASQIIEDLLGTIAMPSVNLPKIIAFPDIAANSPVISLIRAIALSNGLPMAMTKPTERPVLNATKDVEHYFRDGLGGHHRRDVGRLWRKLERQGTLRYDIARSVDDIRAQMEEFLLLENAGWKGRQRTSLAADRYRAAFAREAINSLAEVDKCRIHTITLDDKVIASLIVFVDGSNAWTWKTTFDEEYRPYSPGKLLMVCATEAILDDPNIQFADSCAPEGHSMMGHLWQERREITTLVVGLDITKDREVRQAAAQMDLYTSTKETAKKVQTQLKTLIKKF
ncbi:MAG: GNAT family N-acetyltransferase [Pseudomonadota bacterium]